MSLLGILKIAALGGAGGVISSYFIKKDPIAIVGAPIISGMYPPGNENFYDGAVLGVVQNALALAGAAAIHITGDVGKMVMRGAGFGVGVLASGRYIESIRIIQMATFIGALEGTNTLNQALLEGKGVVDSVVLGTMSGAFHAVTTIGCGALAQTLHEYMFGRPTR